MSAAPHLRNERVHRSDEMNLRQAYRENLSLRQAGVRVLQARAELGIVVGEVFPQTQQGVGSVQYSRLSDRAVASVASNGSVTYWQSQIGAQASWERRTNWGQLLAPATYNLPASREPDSAPRRPDW